MDKIEVTQADRTLYHQLLSLGSVNLNRRRMGLPIVDGLELIAAHRLATRTDATTDPDEEAAKRVIGSWFQCDPNGVFDHICLTRATEQMRKEREMWEAGR